MSTEKSIRIEFNQVKAQATALNSCASDLSDVSTKLGSIVDTLSAGWQGDSATLFLQKCEALQTKLTKTSSNLQTVSRVVSNAANSYYQTEMKAIELAKTNSGS